jgi:hypothetical protein
MKKICCVACKFMFHPKRHVVNQKFCSKKKCQQNRRSMWLQNKLKADDDYKENQKRVFINWKENNPYYWRKYAQKKGSMKKMIFPKDNLEQSKKKEREYLNVDIKKADIVKLAVYGKLILRLNLIL